MIIAAQDPSRLSFSGVSIDSRTLQSGELFFAIRGSRFNGHDFLTRAVERGARALVVDHFYADTNGSLLKSLLPPTIVVDDTIQALGEFASGYRDKFDLPILAVGGSNGKTTTKDMIAAVLKSRFNILTTEGNLNNQIGVPMMLFRLRKQHEVAVIEIGTNHFGEINYLCSILKPSHALITNIGHEHLEFFGNLRGVAKAEMELHDWLDEHNARRGVAFVNTDDPYLKAKSPKLKKLIFYGFETRGGDYKGSQVRLDQNGCASFEVKPKGKTPFTISLGVPGIHNAKNALAAAAVGHSFRVPVTGIQRALAEFASPSKRSEVIEINGVRIINDSYNSNPDSAKAALDMLTTIRSEGKRIAVLGDMLELGVNAEEQHTKVGRAASKAKVDYLLTYGPLSIHTHEAAAVPFKTHYAQKNMLAEYLAELISPGDLVLVKGSRGMKMEDIVLFLKERFAVPQPV